VTLQPPAGAAARWPAEIAPRGPRRAPAPAVRRSRSAPHARALPSGVPVDWIAVSLVGLGLVLLGTVPSTLLTHLKIHYVSTGGAFYEKFHPSTWVFILALGVILLRDGRPAHELDRIIARAPLVLPYAFAILLVVVQSIVLHRPVTSAVDTFVVPLLAFCILCGLSPAQRTPLVWTIHLLILLNVLLGYFEYFSGHRLIPLPVAPAGAENPALLAEWRSTALLGHPLSASALVGAYTLALLFRPSLVPAAALRIPLTFLCLGSLFCFGGRTALVMVLLGAGTLAAVTGIRAFRGLRVPLGWVIVATCVAFLLLAGIFALIAAGFLDKMLLRFSSDNGSALARLTSLQLLASLDWNEVLLGAEPARVDSLQLLLGIRVGIEDFWIACIAQYGLICTVLLTIGLGGFLAEVLRRCHPAARAHVLFLIVIAAASVSFSVKNVTLTQHVCMMLLLLARDRTAAVRPARAAVARAARLAARPADA
jgi:hypothetical protein